MPEVKDPKTGKVKHFPYTPAGKAAAAAAAKKVETLPEFHNKRMRKGGK